MNAVATERENRAVRVDQSADVRYASPDADIFETKDGYVLLAEMPGVTKDGLEVTLEENTLTLVGHRPTEGPKGEVVYCESHPVHYRRVFELDPTIDTGKVTARMDQGVLTLELPKAEKAKPRRISLTD
jgi:HSP20 family protein